MGSSEIRDVASMNHKIDIFTFVDVRYHGLCFVIPPLSITDKGNTERFLVFQVFFDEFDVLFVEILFSTYICIIRM